MTKMPKADSISLLQRLAGKDDAIVCVQDGVYWLRQDLSGWPCQFYGCEADLAARSIRTPYAAISYPALIDLIFRAARVISI